MTKHKPLDIVTITVDIFPNLRQKLYHQLNNDKVIHYSSGCAIVFNQTAVPLRKIFGYHMVDILCKATKTEVEDD